MSKPKKVYVQAGQKIVCHRGAHFTAPADSRVDPKRRYGVIDGELPETVIVLCGSGEVWNLKGSYTEPTKGRTSIVPKGGRKRSKPRKVVPPQPTVKPLDEALRLIKEEAPNAGAECLMRVAYQNWCHPGMQHLALFQGFRYPSEATTCRVHALGLAIMEMHR